MIDAVLSGAERWTVAVGDAAEVLRGMPDGCVQCCVTSPPYWGLRDYGVAGQLGLEPSPEEYVAAMVGVFREVRRVLRDDGVLWLNLGSCFAGSATAGDKRPGSGRADGIVDDRAQRNRNGVGAVPGLKPKDLVGIPWLVAFALQADGWWLRSDVIWSKPNPMPESVTDRPASAHEHVFLLAKSALYFYDADAVREGAVGGNAHDLTGPGASAPGQTPQRGNRGRTGCGSALRAGNDHEPRERSTQDSDPPRGSRNLRDVWTIATCPTPEAHFATFPPALVTPCIKAGTSERGACPTCGAPWERVVERGDVVCRGGSDDGKLATDATDTSYERRFGGALTQREHTTTGFRPTCDCYDDRYREDFPYPRSARKRWQRDISGDHWRRVRQRPGLDGWAADGCVVLDPFCGTATAGEVALLHGRRFIGIELSAEYAEQFARPRLETAARGLGPKAARRARDAEASGQMSLFGGDA